MQQLERIRYPFLASLLVPVAILRPDWAQALGLAGALLFALAVRNPRRRWMKYDGAFVVFGLICANQAQSAFGNAAARALALGVPLWLPVLTSGCYFLLARPGTRLDLARATYRFTRRAFGSAGAVVILLTMVWYPFAAAFMAALLGCARFMAVLRLTAEPIIYLRKFDDAGTAGTFHDLLAPVVSPRHVLIGLTKPSDHRALVKSDLKFTPVHLYSVPDAEWRDWVASRIEASIGAIVDARRSSEYLEWELGQAHMLLPAGNTLVLVDADVRNLPGVECLQIDGRERGEVAAALLTWVEGCAQRAEARRR